MIVAHFDGHGVVSAYIAHVITGQEVYCKYPETGPNGWSNFITKLKAGDIVLDIASDATNPEKMKELLAEAEGGWFWIDEHPMPQDVYTIAKARGVFVIRTSTSFLTTIMPLILFPKKIDMKKKINLMRLAKLGAICDRDPTVTVTKEELEWANGIDVLVRKHGGYTKDIEELFDKIIETGDFSQLSLIEGGPRIPEGVTIFSRRHYIEIKDAVEDPSFALKDVELLLMARGIPYAVFHYHVPRFGTWNVALIKAVYVRYPNIIPLLYDEVKEIVPEGATMLPREAMIQVIKIKDENTAYSVQKRLAYILEKHLTGEAKVITSESELRRIIEEAVRNAMM